MVAQSSKQTTEMQRSKLIQVNRSPAGINQNLRDRLGKPGVAK
jgi:hypothetical protein